MKNFYDYYIIEDDGGEHLTKFVGDVVGGDKVGTTRKALPLPGDEKRRRKNRKCADGSKPPCKDDPNPDPICPDGSKPPCKDDPICPDGSKPPCDEPDPICPDGSNPPCKDRKPRKEFKKDFAGGHGYMVHSGSEWYDELVDKILGGEYDDRIIRKTKINNKEKFMGWKVVFDPIGEESEYPENYRTMWILRDNPKYKNPNFVDESTIVEKKKTTNNKNKKTPTEKVPKHWSALSFLSKYSFEDALKTFLPDMLKDKEALRDAAENLKWHMADTVGVGDPSVYANWTYNKIPESDINSNKALIKKALREGMDNTDSFSKYYIFNTLMEQFGYDITDDDILFENIVMETFIDDALTNTFKGIGGGIKTALFQPKPIKISNPSQLTKYFPPSSTYKVSEGAFAAVNALCVESMSEYNKLKADYGPIARKFISTKNTYVTKSIEIHMNIPEDPDKKERWEDAMDKVIKSFSLEGYEFNLESIVAYKTTDGGIISTMVIVVREEDKNPKSMGDSVDPLLELDDSEDSEDSGNDVEDLTAASDNIELIYIVGIDSKGEEFFEKNYNASIKQFVQRHSSGDLAKLKQDRESMKSHTSDLLKQAQQNVKGNRSGVYIRDNIDNKEYKSILQSFNTKFEGDSGPKKSGPTVVKRQNGVRLTSFVLGNGAKVMFLDKGKGQPGKIIFTKSAKKFMTSGGTPIDSLGNYKLVNPKDMNKDNNNTEV